MTSRRDPFGARSVLETPAGRVTYYSLEALAKRTGATLDTLPYSIRVLMECVLRNCDGTLVKEEDVLAAARWSPTDLPKREIPFMPSRVLLQDFTGVPAVVDLASMRSAMQRMGGDPRRINPVVPSDLVIDHSVQVDYFGSADAFRLNVEREYQRNQERYAFLRWAQSAFSNLSVVPPDTGICHQINLEYLSRVVATRKSGRTTVAFPDTVVGLDSHTTMVNGLSVLGWGVGGIEAEAVMLGQPYYMLMPPVVGVRLTGELREGVTATDLVLTVVEMLRKVGVVEKFVEFYGPGLSKLPLPDRATLGNMAPEYGATCGFFPIDQETLRYLAGTGRDPAHVELVERYARAQGLFRTDGSPEPRYSETLVLDMGMVEPSLAGPKRPQDRVPLKEMRPAFQKALAPGSDRGLAQTPGKPAGASVKLDGHQATLAPGSDRGLDHGAVVIAAITSCTNTSNPSVMVGAGLLARNALARGLRPKPWVKTSLAPGSRVVTDYLRAAGVTEALDALGFQTVGYGCTTCIGNSGPLPEPVARAVSENDLTVAAVLSGNRNFEGRVHPQVRANYLASPMLVVAFALAGRVDVDLTSEPLGQGSDGRPVYLRDIWPTQEQVRDTVSRALNAEMFRQRYAQVFQGDEVWRSMPVPKGDLYAWDDASTYIRELPIFEEMPEEPGPLRDIEGARVLAILGDSITTDHISPAGSIPAKSPAGQYLIERGVQPADFNTFGARRGNHEVMIRGTFGNIRLRNALVPDTEGFYTLHLPDKQKTTIYEAALRYQAEGVPLLVLAGVEYGAGSSRDWAAKGPFLLGVRAALAESYERIHRSNLLGMGVLPLQYKPGQSRQTLGLTGLETYSVTGIASGIVPGQAARVTARRDDGSETRFEAIVRIDTPIEVEYYRHGGLLQYVLRKMVRG
ncbi:MAG: aconitate hydratase AcnA [Chloroflexota bacterium]|nr:aconitate hydratase AcnA [Chloroflexota bacterium]